MCVAQKLAMLDAARARSRTISCDGPVIDGNLAYEDQHADREPIRRRNASRKMFRRPMYGTPAGLALPYESLPEPWPSDGLSMFPLLENAGINWRGFARRRPGEA